MSTAVRSASKQLMEIAQAAEQKEFNEGHKKAKKIYDDLHRGQRKILLNEYVEFQKTQNLKKGLYKQKKIDENSLQVTDESLQHVYRSVLGEEYYNRNKENKYRNVYLLGTEGYDEMVQKLEELTKQITDQFQVDDDEPLINSQAEAASILMEGPTIRPENASSIEKNFTYINVTSNLLENEQLRSKRENDFDQYQAAAAHYNTFYSNLEKKAKLSTKDLGFTAQELENILPSPPLTSNCVFTSKMMVSKSVSAAAQASTTGSSTQPTKVQVNASSPTNGIDQQNILLEADVIGVLIQSYFYKELGDDHVTNRLLQIFFPPRISSTGHLLENQMSDEDMINRYQSHARELFIKYMKRLPSFTSQQSKDDNISTPTTSNSQLRRSVSVAQGTHIMSFDIRRLQSSFKPTNQVAGGNSKSASANFLYFHVPSQMNIRNYGPFVPSNFIIHFETTNKKPLKIGEERKFELHVKNKGKKTADYRIYTLDCTPGLQRSKDETHFVGFNRVQEIDDDGDHYTHLLSISQKNGTLKKRSTMSITIKITQMKYVPRIQKLMVIEFNGCHRIFIKIDVHTEAIKQYSAHPLKIDRVYVPKYEGYIPKVLVYLYDHFKRINGFKQEGVFRMAGNGNNVEKWKRQITIGHYYVRDSVHDIADLIKIYFREMKQRMLDHIPFADIRDMETQSMDDIWPYLESMPSHLKPLWNWMLDLMVDVSLYEHINKMTISNMGTVMSPNIYNAQRILLQSGVKGPAAMSQMLVINSKILEFLITCIKDRKENRGDDVDAPMVTIEDDDESIEEEEHQQKNNMRLQTDELESDDVKTSLSTVQDDYVSPALTMDRLYCPITRKLLQHPVVLVETGQTYERDAILDWINEYGSDPMTGEGLGLVDVVPNITIEEYIKQYRDELPEDYPGEEEGEFEDEPPVVDDDDDDIPDDE